MKLVIFDFDGVLINTIEFSFLEHKKYNPNLTYQKFQSFCNGNFCDGVDKAVAEGSHLVPKDWDKSYIENTKRITINEILNKAIKTLSKEYLISIVSSSGSIAINNFLEKEKVKNYFTDILGVDVHRDKTEKIKSLLEKYKISPNAAVFVTDTLGDILEAEKCGVKSIGVTWGLHGRKTLEKGNPVAIIDDPRDLLKTIKNVL